ncbi:DNA cytosine methyltransferase [Microbacterium hydrocarbonoxydans]|uniref:DNA cytosine methyltransferase n=1 Tax=Microbacterium hydrocarbonoxydans TaxID=273678 RepID=UPI00203A794F|nr:DNA (cytosine-5-)-methyltransferase [Microbacterium hydrocarbonoxydans]MCM3778398.1 DNA cytosine methyltransferase [Microbacterium hydrocarbonoxydans]
MLQAYVAGQTYDETVPESRRSQDSAHTLVEVCAGAGGQSLGLHKAGFSHALAVEIDETAAQTLRSNLGVDVAVGDVADRTLWHPREYEGVDMFAGGVPCPPFSAAGKQLGTGDERDLFAWAIEQVGVIQPRAVMLENVRGLSSPRFAAYRQRILDRLDDLGYVGEWKLLHAADFGVPQLRPRFVLVAMRADEMRYFHWPEPRPGARITVGEALHDLMAADGWKYADAWREAANDIGPTLVGGSKKHGGADLGPTRAKAAWAKLGVDGRGIADTRPNRQSPSFRTAPPRLTIEMAARVQGWKAEDAYTFAGRKTSQYRQIGNAFPPPVAEALGRSVRAALTQEGIARVVQPDGVSLQDPVYRALASSDRPLSLDELVGAYNEGSTAAVQQRLAAIGRDFELHRFDIDGSERYLLGDFRGFTGQEDHWRHEVITRFRSKVS